MWTRSCSRIQALAIALAAVTGVGLALADGHRAPDGDALLPTRNMHPVQLIFPAPGLDRVDVVGEGQWRWAVSIVETNTFNIRSYGGDVGAATTITLDAETTRVLFEAEYGLSSRWSVAVRVPFVRRWGGFLDRPIEEVEDVFGQLNPNRTRVPRDLSELRYVRSGRTVFDLNEATSGLADASVEARFRAWRSADGLSQLVLGGTLELPTGDEEELLGSGGVDATLSAAATRRSGRWLFAGQVSGVAPEEEVFEGTGVTTDPFMTAGVAAAWAWTARTHVFVAVDCYGSPLGHTRTDELEDPLLELVAGASFELGQGWRLQLAFVENLIVEPGADISLVFRIGHDVGR